MPDTSPLSLRALLPERLERIDTAVRDVIGDGNGLQQGQIAWRFLGKKVGDCIQGAIDMDLLNVLADAWSTARELHAYAGPPEHLRGKNIAVTLGQHEFTHTVRLELELSVNGGRAGPPLPLDLDLTASIESVVLTIRDGRLVGVGSGEGRVSLQLKYKEVPLHEEVRSVDLGRTAHLTLQPGITLP